MLGLKKGTLKWSVLSMKPQRDILHATKHIYYYNTDFK